MVKEVNMEKMLADATENFTTGFMCSESVLEVLNRHYELGRKRSPFQPGSRTGSATEETSAAR